MKYGELVPGDSFNKWGCNFTILSIGCLWQPMLKIVLLVVRNDGTLFLDDLIRCGDAKISEFNVLRNGETIWDTREALPR